MIKNKEIKIKMSIEDMRKLKFCEKVLGQTKSNIIRKGVEKTAESARELEKEKKYAEIFTRIDGSHESINIINKSLLLISLTNGEESEFPEAEELIKKINAGESIKYVFNKEYVYEYRIATEEDIRKAEDEEKKEDEIFAPYIDPLIEKFMANLYPEYKK